MLLRRVLPSPILSRLLFATVITSPSGVFSRRWGGVTITALTKKSSQLMSAAASAEPGVGDLRAEGGQRDEGEKKRCAAEKPRASHFLSVRLKSSELNAMLTSVQSDIISMEPRLKAAATPMAKLHITFYVTALHSPELIERAKQVLLSSAESVNALLSSHSASHLLLPVQGLSHFKHQVLFADFPSDHSTIAILHLVADLMKKHFLEAGLPDVGMEFSPHATLFKMSKVSKTHWQRQGLKKLHRIDPKCYAKWKATHFGTAQLEEIELLSMVDPAAADGYYHSLSSIPLGQWSPTACNATSNPVFSKPEETDGDESTLSTASPTAASVDAPVK